MSGPDGGEREGAGEIRLADPGRPDDQDTLVRVHPARAGEIEQLTSIQPTGMAEVDVLDRGIQAQLGGSHVPFEPPVLALGHLAVHEQPQTVFEAETAIGCGLFALLGQTMGHTREIEAVELVEGGTGEHVVLLSAVVGGAADVGVVAVGTPCWRRGQGRPVEPVL